ncbi:C40 family peptidase [Corynebacterium sp. L4756]|uniref:C40 family peptidase n=1 Tax=unclassified Corynebacterium TaxID=2624378 RepID=UPI00374DEE45
MSPPQIPQLQLVNAPDMAALAPLAQTAGADPSKILDAVGIFEADQSTIFTVAQEASGRISACGFDLIKLGAEFLTMAAPLAAASLLPHPATRASSQAALKALVWEYLARAAFRCTELAGELLGIANPLTEIAARPVVSAVSAGLDDLETLQAVSQQAGTHIPGAKEVSTQLGNVRGLAESSLSITSDSTSSGSAPATGASPGSGAGGGAGSSTGGGTGSSVDSGSSGAGDIEDSGEASAAGEKAVDTALSMVGTPYVWGGTSPQGFDCSGLTQYAYREAGVELPRLAEQQTVGQQVSADQLVKGDLVVWDGHVAMYAGDGQIVEAGDPVQVNPLRTSNMGMEFKGFWRPTA